MSCEHYLWMPHFAAKHINRESPRVHLKSVYVIKYYLLQELIKHIKRSKWLNPISSTLPHPAPCPPRAPQPHDGASHPPQRASWQDPPGPQRHRSPTGGLFQREDVLGVHQLWVGAHGFESSEELDEGPLRVWVRPWTCIVVFPGQSAWLPRGYSIRSPLWRISDSGFVPARISAILMGFTTRMIFEMTEVGCWLYWSL